MRRGTRIRANPPSEKGCPAPSHDAVVKVRRGRLRGGSNNYFNSELH